MARCPYCQARIPSSARKCQYCGEWVKPQPSEPPAPSREAQSSPRPVATPATSGQGVAPSRTTVIIQQDESVAFAVVTLLLYIFVYPLGLLLNFIGLITGPRRGCFVWMFLIGFVLPALVIVVLIMMGVPVLYELNRFLSSW